MPSSIYTVPFLVGVGPVVPGIIWEDAQEGDGMSCVGQVPEAETCMVRLTSTDEKLDAIAALPDCLFYADVPEVIDVS